MTARSDTPTGEQGRLTRHRKLALLAAMLALMVIGLGAWVRLSDAGLGCPDWPGCYGHWLGIPDSPEEHAVANARFPARPVESGKAWKEMVHRYAAATLGLLVLWLLARRSLQNGRPPAAESTLTALVIVQALLGMWTVTLLLKPVIVTAHLLGGMLVWSLLVSLAISPAQQPAAPTLRHAGSLAVLLIVGQIALGGWVSSNYAALACPQLPTCPGGLWPAADWGTAFRLNHAGGELPDSAMIAIHWAHRLGAAGVALATGLFAVMLLRQQSLRHWGRWISAALLLQISLGAANVLWQLPLALAVAHTLGAALLLAVTLSARRALTSTSATGQA